MSILRKLRAGRVAGQNAELWVGQVGTIFYNETTGELRIADGQTPGGFPIPITLATETTAGTIKLGPGVILNSQGQVIIDPTGLDFAFGDFEARVDTYPETHPKEGNTYALLSSINSDQDIVVASNGQGSIKLIGDFEVYAPNGDINNVLLEEPFFKVQRDGQVKIRVPSTDPVRGAVEITGTTSGLSVAPAVTGVMLHITGNNNEFATVYTDGVNNFSNYIGRRYNGTATAPTQVKAGNVVCRFSGTGYGTSAFPSGAAASMSIVALEDYTDSQQGTKIEFLTAPIGSLTRELVATVSVADGVSATKFTGPLVGTASTATSLAAAANILAGTVNINPTVITRSSASVQTFTLTGLTTNHKIVITSGTAFGYGLFITAAWASAANTLSIEIQNFLGNQDVDLPAKNIQYFAWV